ncbi:MAG TPA: hypothetical protein VG406_01720 [Isosphaeraceae bacterium]|nr:hypothetical protein [Isosphaeraceae bacterium]
MLATGPKTPEGKANSRGNALKHGLTGEGVVLPAEEEAKVAERLEKWEAIFKPADDYEKEQLRRVVVAGRRVDRAVGMESARRVEAASRARSCWADDRRLAAEELAQGLAKRPAMVARQLRRTLQGCELLLDRWHGLLRDAEAGTSWDEARRARALDLLGVPVDDRENHPRVNAKATAGDLAAVAQAEIEHLEGRLDGYLLELDESERQMVESGLAFDVSPAGRRLWGYERANERVFFRGLDELHRRRRDRGDIPAAPRPRPEPKGPVAATLRMPSAPTHEPVRKADGTRSVPATEDRADGMRGVPATEAVAVAIAKPTIPATAAPAPEAGNRRWRRAQKALARRRA